MKKEGKLVDVRGLALETLTRAFDQGEFLKTAIHRVLEENEGLDKRDRAFLTRLSNGVMDKKLALDYIIGEFSNVPPARIRPTIRNILRMGVYQIMDMSQVPDGAACNESVKLAKRRGFGSLSGYVNGVLRQVARHKDEIHFPEPWIQYSVPRWLFDVWAGERGYEAAVAMASHANQEAGTTVWCNEAKVGADELYQAFGQAGVEAVYGTYHRDALRLVGFDRIEKLPGYDEGWFQVQDESSMFVAESAGIEAGWRVLDVCAAPGGKALRAAHILLRKEKERLAGGGIGSGDVGIGKVWACDVSDHKVKRLEENVKRLGLDNIEAVKWDARLTREDWLDAMDLVMADLPCSGLGLSAKKSDVKYRVTPEDLLALQGLQREMLKNVSRYVKPGGILLYSTCTVHRGENEENVEWAIRNLPFTLDDLNPYLPTELQGETTGKGYVQWMQGVHDCDGFFLARLRRLPT